MLPAKLGFGTGVFATGVLATALCLSAGGRAKQRAQAGASSAGSLAGSGANSKNGRFLFARDCAHCHGMLGDGNSPVRGTLHPVPLDLTGFEFTESYILDILHEGVPGSDMPAWHSSPESDLRTVSAYTARLGRPDVLTEADHYASPEALQEAGRRIYLAHCSRCHGQGGEGDGEDATRYLPAPPSFQGMRPSYDEARRIIQNGIRGTAMAAWPLLTQQEIQAVTYYIRSLYAGEANAGQAKESSTLSGALSGGSSGEIK